jgi:predicted Rossmann fold flavoprotein
MTTKRVIVIGAGAGGMMAACRAAELGAHVLLLEKNTRPGNKILISGKTRCNLSNTKNLDGFIAMYGLNGRFLYSAFHRFFRDDLLAFLRNCGVETRTETDGRVFPDSDDARDVVRAFERYMYEHDVQLRTNTRVTGIQVDKGHIAGVQTEKETLTAKTVVLATGGASYPLATQSPNCARL